MHCSMTSFLQTATESRSSSLSIFVEDVDSKKEICKPEAKCSKKVQELVQGKIEASCCNQQHVTEDTFGTWYSRKTVDQAIQQVMEEMQKRKHEFSKLLDEHDAVIEHIKRIEQEGSVCKISSHSPIMT